MKLWLLIFVAFLVSACSSKPKKVLDLSEQTESKSRVPASLGKLNLIDCSQNPFGAKDTHWASDRALYSCRLVAGTNRSKTYTGSITYEDLTILAVKYGAKIEIDNQNRLRADVPTVKFSGNGVELSEPPNRNPLGDDYINYHLANLRFLGTYKGITREELIDSISKSFAGGRCPDFSHYFSQDVLEAARALYEMEDPVATLNSKIAKIATDNRQQKVPRLVSADADSFDTKVQEPATYLRLENSKSYVRKSKVILGPNSSPVSCQE